MVARVFDHAILHSYDRLQNFFQTSDAIQQVLDQRNRAVLPNSSSTVEIKPSLNSHLLPKLYGGWRVCQLATAPLRWMLSIVLRGIAALIRCLGGENFSKQIKRVAQRFDAGFALPLGFFKRYEPLLQKAVNRINDQGGVSQTPPILRDQIEDVQVRNRVLYNKHAQVKFSSKRGICRGMCEWFVYLYFKTKDQFTDPRNHMLALAEQFTHGGGMEPTLLQRMNLKNGKLLGLRIGVQEERVHGQPGKAALNRTFFDWKQASEERIRELNNLPVGIYYVNLTFHAVTYVKVDDTSGFLFDPNLGLFEVSGKEKGGLLYFFLLDQLGFLVKETIKTGRIWDLFPGLTPEQIQPFRKLPKQRALELITSRQVPNLSIQFVPMQMRVPE